MRLRSFALLGTLTIFACSATAEEDTHRAAVDELTEDELATAALKIMGAPQLQEPGSPPSCGFTGCHSINPLTLKHWNQQMLDATAFLASDATPEAKIDSFRQDPRNRETGFTPERIGVLAAGTHLALGANVNEQRHPLAYAQGKKLAEIFAGKEALYAKFRDDMLMPVLPEYPRLSAREYETVLAWFTKGMPKLTELLPEERPTSCTDDFGPLRAYASEVKNDNWAAQNRSNRLPMLGCDPDAKSPTQCLRQTRDGNEVFPSAVNTSFAKSWPLDGSTVRILRELTSPNSFWLRSSADGRFVMTGGGQNGGAQAIDLQATLEGASRDIGLAASYDPDFWPDNKAFMFQGGTKFCAQSLLEKTTTTKVTFGESECSNLSSASGLYQTVGQTLGDNSISDRFILYSVWAGDSGQYSASARDTQPRAGLDAAINVFVAVAKGNDVVDGYQVLGQGTKIPTPYEGDTMMARSGKIIGSRVAGAHGSLGYSIERLKAQPGRGQYSFELSKLGRVCMIGNKANFSFDERFLATHHYNEPAEYAEGDDPAYKDKGSADVYVADFVTGKKQRVTKMGPGQFALYAHFRSDGWLYFLVVDHNTQKYYVAASDWAVRQAEEAPTP